MKTKNKEKYDLWAWWAGRNEPDGTVWTMLLDSSGINNNTLLTTSNDRNHLFHSKSSYKNGFWTVTITSPLISPAQLENDHYFQISIFDNTYSDHSISNDPQVLVFVRNKGVKQ